ncbi:MAG: hypothetical protein ACERKX_05560 [Anaerolineales bacterium]
MRYKTALTSAIMLVLYALAPVWTSASASGPGVGGRRVRLDDVVAGPYLVRAVTSPTPPTVENLYVEVRVTGAESGEVLTDLDVVVRAIPLENDAPELSEIAVHDIAPIPTEYAAHLPVAVTGLWEIQIDIQGPEGGGSATFIERVQNPPNLSWLVAIGAPIAGLCLLGAIFFWLQRNSQQET